jgi:hypothetical protein
MSQALLPNERWTRAFARRSGKDTHVVQLEEVQGRDKIGIHNHVVLAASRGKPVGESEDSLSGSWNFFQSGVDEVQQIAILGVQTLRFDRPNVRFVAVVALEWTIHVVARNAQLIDSDVKTWMHV